jgi:hypothetical protein
MKVRVPSTSREARARKRFPFKTGSPFGAHIRAAPLIFFGIRTSCFRHADFPEPRFSGVRLAPRGVGRQISGWPTSESPTIHPEPWGTISAQIASDHANGWLPWAYARPGAAFSARVRMEPKSSGILGMFHRSRFNLRARSKAPRLEISRNSGTS